ncbi:hypothetical protein OSTOST_19752 [Ostertagia ostertagi]
MLEKRNLHNFYFQIRVRRGKTRVYEKILSQYEGILAVYSMCTCKSDLECIAIKEKVKICLSYVNRPIEKISKLEELLWRASPTGPLPMIDNVTGRRVVGVTNTSANCICFYNKGNDQLWPCYHQKDWQERKCSR